MEAGSQAARDGGDEGAIFQMLSLVQSGALNIAPGGEQPTTTINEETNAPKISQFKLGLHLNGAPPVGRFVGRWEELEQLRQHLLPTEQKPGRRVVVLHGHPGLGKTHLSIEFARQHGRNFTSVFWLDGSTQDNLEKSIARLRSCLDVKPQPSRIQESVLPLEHHGQDVDAVLGWFSLPGNGRWLLVVDGFGSEDESPQPYKIESYFPTADHGSILVTARGLTAIPSGAGLRLEGMAAVDAKKLLGEEGREHVQNNDANLAKEALGLLGGHPIALRVAGAFIRETKCTIRDFLETYHHRVGSGLESDENSSTSVPLDMHPSVKTMMIIICDRLRHIDSPAWSLFNLWTYLDNRDLWYGLFSPKSPLPGQSPSLSWYRSAAASPGTFLEGMKTLEAYGISQPVEDPSGHFVHRLILQCAQQALSKVRDPELAWLAVRTVGRAIPDDVEKIEASLKDRLEAHARRCYCLVTTKTAEPYFTSENPFLPDDNIKLDTGLIYFASVLRLGKFLGHIGMTNEAVDLLECVSQAYGNIMGPTSPITLDTINATASVLVAGGKLIEAEKLYLEVLKTCDVAPEGRGSDDFATVRTAHSLAVLQKKLKKYDKSEIHYRRVLDVYVARKGSDDSSTAHIAGELALICGLQEKLDDAAKLYLLALRAQRVSKDIAYVTTLTSISRLVLVAIASEKLVEAEKLAVACLRETEQAPQGLGNIQALEMIEVVREIYTKNGKFDDAERMYVRALESYELFLPAQQKEMADLAYNLANFYTLRGRFEEAEPVVTKALRAYEESLGPDHHYTLDALANLANILNQQGKETEAEKTDLQALERKEKSLGPEHRKTLESVNNMGAFYFGQNKFEKAESFYLRALDGFRKALGENHSVTLGVLTNMSTLYREQSRTQDAAASLLLAVDGYESAILESQNTLQESDKQPMMERNPGSVIFMQYSGTSDKEDLSAFLPGFTAALGSLESLAGTYVREKNSVGAEDLFWRLVKAKTFLGMPISESSHLLSVLLLQRCIMEMTGKEEPMALQTTSTDWPDPSPIWRLIHLVETYGSPELFNILCKTLMQIGDERVRAGLQLEVIFSIEESQSSGRACDRCQTDISPDTGWYVCRSCLKDTDLCEPCFASRREGWESHSCCRHNFYAVFAADMEDEDTSGSDLASWLNDVKMSYATEYEEEEEENSHT
ncbi:hypothetical protein B0H63DRAFT_434637 [Podospora didyma]|uniref:Orc1-like AAA ATPase domain-containing protein n=1 Tax=Podospora didyma TaxID=330526 RepID=A0AAE0TVR6_9PEZI|nr:hypothetical protein B0H63DRAFT_434637 [Podospora didyma]